MVAETITTTKSEINLQVQNVVKGKEEQWAIFHYKLDKNYKS